MLNRKTLTPLGTILLLALHSLTTNAHHSTAVYDKTQRITLQGEVKEYQHTNPHSWLQLYVTNENGEQIEWGLEGGSPNFLRRKGWSASVLQPGDKISADIHPLRDGQPGGILIQVTLENGTMLEDIPPP